MRVDSHKHHRENRGTSDSRRDSVPSDERAGASPTKEDAMSKIERIIDIDTHAHSLGDESHVSDDGMIFIGDRDAFAGLRAEFWKAFEERHAEEARMYEYAD